MLQLNCIIVDDEPFAVKGIEMYIKDYAILNLIRTFTDAIKAQEFLNTYQIDLVFLDIEMPNISGFELINNLKKPPFIIITTAYPQYVADAFELNVIDYLLKPISPVRFEKTVKKISYYFNTIPSIVKKISNNFIYIKAERKQYKIFFRNIIYIEGLKDYVIIYTNDDKLITAINLKNILLKLPESDFFRISKSYIVNIKYIQIIYNDSIIINNKTLPIGKAFKNDFLKTINQKKT